MKRLVENDDDLFTTDRKKVKFNEDEFKLLLKITEERKEELNKQIVQLQTEYNKIDKIIEKLQEGKAGIKTQCGCCKQHRYRWEFYDVYCGCPDCYTPICKDCRKHEKKPKDVEKFKSFFLKMIDYDVWEIFVASQEYAAEEMYVKDSLCLECFEKRAEKIQLKFDKITSSEN